MERQRGCWGDGQVPQGPPPPRGPDPFSLASICFWLCFCTCPRALHFPLSAIVSSSCSLNFFCLVLTPPPPLLPPPLSPALHLFHRHLSLDFCSVCASISPSLDLCLPACLLLTPHPCCPLLLPPPPPLPGERGGDSAGCRHSETKCYPGW